LKDFLDKFWAKYSVSNLMKICPGRAKLFHAEDGRTEKETEMTKLIVDFCSFAKAHKNRSREHAFKNIDNIVIAEFCKE